MPLAHSVPWLQKAPGGARHVPPAEHGVLSGQSAAVEQLWQAPPFAPQKWSMQLAGVQASDPEAMQNLLVVQLCAAQSPLTAHGAPPGRAQTPALQCVLAQSAPVAQAAQTWAAQRPLPHAASEPQASPSASLQKPAWQMPLKHWLPAVQGSRKAPRLPLPVHMPPVAQMARFSHMPASPTPSGSAVQLPTWPGIAHELQTSQDVAPQQTELTHAEPPAQSLVAAQALPWAHGGQAAPPQSTSVSDPSLMPSLSQTGPASLPAPPVPLLEVEVELEVELVVLLPLLEVEPAAPPVPLLDVDVVLNVVPAPPVPHVRRTPQSDES